MMRSTVGLASLPLAPLLGLAAACSSAPAPASGAAEPAPIVINDEREARLSAALGQHVPVDNLPAIDSLPAPLQSAHRALVAAYAELGIPATIVDPAGTLVAVTEFRVRGEIARTRASRFLSCGATLTGARADEDRVLLSVVSRLTPSGSSSTRIETRVVATATDTRGTGSRQACTTTGELEARLLRGARKALGS